MKDPSLAMAVESCLRSFMKAFCCDNYKDEAVLQQLMRRHYPQGNRPQIIVSLFSTKIYNTHGRSAVFQAFCATVFQPNVNIFCFHRKVFHPEFPSMVDVITATSPVIINCLIDMRGIESVLIIKVNVLQSLVFFIIIINGCGPFNDLMVDLRKKTKRGKSCSAAGRLNTAGKRSLLREIRFIQTATTPLTSA